MSVRVQVRKVRPDAVVPRYMTDHAAGVDLCAAIDAPFEVARHERVAIPTGLAIALPADYEAQVRPRSGLARDHGITVVNAPGTVDADFRGEIVVLLINLGPTSVTIEPNQRIAQLVVAPVVRAEFVVVDELPPSGRGAGGFGSTGR